jgi:hypothetical protein
MKRIYNSNTMTYSFPDGSGLRTKEFYIEVDMLRNGYADCKSREDIKELHNKIDRLFEGQRLLTRHP